MKDGHEGRVASKVHVGQAKEVKRSSCRLVRIASGDSF